MVFSINNEKSMKMSPCGVKENRPEFLRVAQTSEKHPKI
jgi:hypothetical protein